MIFRPKDRLRILFSILLILGAMAAVSTSFRRHVALKRAAETQARSERHLQQSKLEMQSRIDAGEVWVGQLHGSIDDLPEATAASRFGSPTGLMNQRRIGGTLPLPASAYQVDTDLHECHPGSPLCSTGGSIQVRMGSHFVCAVSIGLLQSSSVGTQPSHFSVQWHPKADGTPLTIDEKLAIVRQLAGGRRPASPAEFRRLLASAYEVDRSEENESEYMENLRSIITTIFSSIAASQDA